MNGPKKFAARKRSMVGERRGRMRHAALRERSMRSIMSQTISPGPLPFVAAIFGRTDEEPNREREEDHVGNRHRDEGVQRAAFAQRPPYPHQE